MSSFFEENRHFISIKLYKEMRGLTDAEKQKQYAKHLRPEVRRRFQLYYAKSNELKHKKSFYSDAIDHFKDYEFNYLIHSIYFEFEAEALFKELGSMIIRNLPPKYNDNYSLIDLLKYREHHNFIDNNIFDLFKRKFDLTITGSMIKNELSNPEANKLSEWLSRSLQIEHSESEVRLLFFHFIKYWHETYSIQFVRYKNYNKSVVLLTKLINCYKAINADKIKLNLSKCINEIRIDVSNLLSGPLNAPYIDTGESALARDRTVITGYLVRLKEFEHILNHNEILFKDLSSLSWLDLFNGHCATVREFKHLYLAAANHKISAGITPTNDEIIYFADRANFNSVKNQHQNSDFFQYIAKSNYIFTYQN